MTLPASKLVIVDDDPVMRSLLVELFVDSGYSVRSTENDEQVTGLVRETLPDVILMDFRDSIGSRCADVEAIKQDPSTGHIPIVALSDSRNLHASPTRSYLHHVVEKPYHPMVLLNQVRRTCEALEARETTGNGNEITPPKAPLRSIE